MTARRRRRARRARPTSTCRRCRRPAGPGDESVDPLWYKRAVFYEVLVRGFTDSNGDGTGDIRGLTERLDYLQWLGVDCIWLLPIYESPLRDGGYDISDFMSSPARVRRPRRLRRDGRRGAQARHPGHRRPRHEPHQRPAPVVPGVPLGPGRPVRRFLRLERHRRAGTRTPASSSSTPRRRTGPGTRCAEQYYWHRFFSHQPDLNFENPAVQEAMLEVLRFWLDLGIDGFRLDAVPYLFEEEGTNCENLPRDPRVPPAGAQGGRQQVRRPGAARRGQPVAGRRRRVLRRRRRVPHGVPLPADAAHLHGGTPGVALPDLGDPGPDAGDPAELPVGHLPAQPRRAHARDGDRRGTRLHVHRVRQGPADEGQHRDPPAARPAAGQQPRPDGAVHRAAAVAARLPGALLRGRDRHGRQHLPR